MSAILPFDRVAVEYAGQHPVEVIQVLTDIVGVGDILEGAFEQLLSTGDPDRDRCRNDGNQQLESK